jgi:hypothetical protein
VGDTFSGLFSLSPGCSGESEIVAPFVSLVLAPYFNSACREVLADGSSDAQAPFLSRVCAQAVVDLNRPTKDWCDEGTGTRSVTFRPPGRDDARQTLPTDGASRWVHFQGYEGDTVEWLCDGMPDGGEWQRTRKARDDTPAEQRGVFGVRLSAQEHSSTGLPWGAATKPTGRLEWTFT